ncbi:MAG: thioredoxin family protein [Thermoguttaceae bacterium]
MHIQILGTGCAKCSKLATLAEEAAKQTGSEYTLEKVTSIEKITALGVMVTPAMIVDGKLKCSGTVPSVAQLAAMLK